MNAVHDQGFENKRYKVIPRTLIFLTHNGSILLIKGAENKKIWPNLFNGIGGHIEKKEDIYSAAKKELFEEAGISNVYLKFCGTITIDLNKDSGILIFIFKGKAESEDCQPGSEGDLHWIKLDEINNYPLVEDLYELIPKLFEDNANLISARYYYDEDKLICEYNEMH